MGCLGCIGFFLYCLLWVMFWPAALILTICLIVAKVAK
jgi:hypothetical protein